ncbi:hypothetical protein SDC9_160369 [bioreactor metagenome]|uniref:Uncharacterized protein n=1 Tax=bioreactor metagenome TaxID=1076179 RepID=A0A645FI76_9ZZZZ
MNDGVYPRQLAPLGRGHLPELLEVVVAAYRRLHDMDDQIADIDQHPFPGVLAFDRDDFAAGLAHLLLNVAGQRLDLAVGVAGGDDQAIEQRGQLGGVDDFNILALDVFEGVDDDFLQLADVHQAFL